MKKQNLILALLVLFLSAGIFSSCNRNTGTCPAYMNGKATGTQGSSDSGPGLFPKKMKKYK